MLFFEEMSENINWLLDIKQRVAETKHSKKGWK